MKRNKVVAGVVGSTAVVLLAVSGIIYGAPTQSTVGIMAGNGPYSTFPTPAPQATALVSTPTSTTSAAGSSTGH